MNTMSFRGVSRFAICISLLSLGLRSGSAADTQSRSSQAPPASDFPAARFQKAITALANANSITIVAEGAPVEFDEKKLQDGTYKTAPLARKIALLAEAADYSAKNSGGVFLLMKRYSNPRDLPCVTLEECRLSLENVSAITTRLLPPLNEQQGSPGELRVQTFFRSLSAQQVEAMGKSPLPLTQLDAGQKDKASTMLASTYLEGINRTAANTLIAISEMPDLWLRKETINRAVFLVWNEKKRPTVTHALLNGDARRAPRTVPIPGQLPPEEAPSTMKREFSLLNQRAASPSATSAVTYDTGAEYAEKPFTVAGLERLDAERAASALTGVYDIRLRSLGSVRQITRRPLLASVTVFNAREAIMAALPAPPARMITAETQDKFLPEGEKEALESSSRGFVKQRNVVLYADEAVRRLRQKREMQLDASGSKGISVASLDITEQRAITVAQISNFLESAAKLVNSPVPIYIEQFANLAVSGKRYLNPEDNKTKIQIGILVPSPSQPNSYVEIAGYSNVRNVETPSP